MSALQWFGISAVGLVSVAFVTVVVFVIRVIRGR